MVNNFLLLDELMVTTHTPPDATHVDRIGIFGSNVINQPALDLLPTRGIATAVPHHHASLAMNGCDLGVGYARDELYGEAERVC